MRSLRQLSFLQQRKLTTSLIVLIAILAFMFAAIPRSLAYADGGAIGSGGSGGSGSSGPGIPYSRKGWGWYDYSSNNGVAPSGFNQGGPWSTVSQTCRNAGADRVIAFIVLKQSGTDASTGVVYDYHSSWDGWQGYRGGAGGNWLPTQTAKGLYDSISVNKSGYTWGGNVAWFCYSTTPPPPPPWSVRSSSSVKVTNSQSNSSDSGYSAGTTVTVQPGQTLHFWHSLTTTNGSVPSLRWIIRQTGGFVWSNPPNIPGEDSSVAQRDNSASGSGTFVEADDFGRTKDGNSSYMTYTVTQNDAGKTLCQKIAWAPYSSSNSKSSEDSSLNLATPACAYVAYNYSLTPLVTINPSGVIEAGASFSVSTLVSNSGSTQNNPAANWTLSKTVSQPGFGDVVTTQTGSGLTVPAKGSATPLAQFVDSDTDKPAGTHVCYTLSVQPFSNSSGNSPTSSAPVCVIVGKKPKVQFWGGNLLVGGLINTSSSVKNVSGANTTFGSWDEYGIFSLGTNTGMASGSAFAGSGLKNVNSACDYSALSFTSAGSSSCTPSTTIGNYTLPSNLPDVASGFLSSSVAIGDTVVPNNLLASPGLFVGTRSGDLTVNASQLDPGKSIILKVSGTVTITGNQTYNPDNNGAKYTGILQLPQLVIIADKIIIKDTVSNVDAWLVAVGSNGILDTCSINASDATSYTLSGNDRLTTNKCNTLLTVNGPVIAQHLWLRRTAGSGPGGASGDSGEIFNLRADAYLWAAARATSSGRIQTVYSTELPPRF